VSGRCRCSNHASAGPKVCRWLRCHLAASSGSWLLLQLLLDLNMPDICCLCGGSGDSNAALIGGVVGGVIGGLLLLAAAVAGVLLWRKRRRRREAVAAAKLSPSTDSSVTAAGLSNGVSRTPLWS
jgi:uncharacterized iron-regulated membrane protein